MEYEIIVYSGHGKERIPYLHIKNIDEKKLILETRKAIKDVRNEMFSGVDVIQVNDI